MSQSPADRLINRITALHRSLQLDDGGKLSTMERDLMLGYLRELYEIYATHQDGKPYTPPALSQQKAPTPSPPTVTTPPPKPAEPVPAPPPPAVTPQPAVTPPPPPPVVNTPPPAPAPPPAPKPAPTPSAPPPAPAPVSGDLKALFADDGPSSRFGRQPLADLAKGLTINTRILFTRDLFGGDNDLLNTSVRTLNGAGSFGAAQPVLESMARRFDWADEGKAETAREFIELVRRRYV